MIKNEKYFYCYSSALHKFLHKVKGLEYICAAINETNNRKFWLYEKTNLLNEYRKEYGKLFK